MKKGGKKEEKKGNCGPSLPFHEEATQHEEEQQLSGRLDAQVCVVLQSYPKRDEMKRPSQSVSQFKIPTTLAFPRRSSGCNLC